MRQQALRYRFDRYALAIDGTLLLRDGTPLALPPKVLRTLLVLLEQAGRVVPKEELLHAVWPDSFVEEVGIARNVSILRHALGDDGKTFIATVPRVGYRFLPHVEMTAEPSAASVAPPEVAPPFRAHAASAPPEPAGRLRSWHGLRLVGRGEQLSRLDEIALALRNGRGGLAAVAGEPGIGKSTLVEEFLSERAGVRRLGRGRCSERLAGTEAHLPILEALTALIMRDATLAAALQTYAPSWSADVAPSGADLALKKEGHEARPAGSVDHLLREITAFLAFASAAEPVILLLEDVHWADLSTVDVIAHLASRLGGMRLLLIVTYRTNELVLADHPLNRLRLQLVAQHLLQEIALPFLSGDDVARYVHDRLGDVPAELSDDVHRRTGGNPLFMSDLVRYLSEHGIQSGSSGDLAGELPGSLRGMVDRTLQRLDDQSLHVLRAAALQGHEFETAILAGALDCDAAAVEDILQDLERTHGLVTVERDHRLPDGLFSRRYRFVHVLYQEALETGITPSRRAELAGRLAAALTTAYAAQSDTIAAVLALLWQIARDPWQASRQYLLASRAAARRFAFPEATELARRGLECLDEPGLRDHPDARRRECDLLFARTVPLAALKGFGAPEIEQLTKEMLRLGQGLSDTAIAAGALGATWMVRMAHGDCRAAHQASQQLISLAEAARDDVLLMNGHMQAMLACHHLGDFGLAQCHADTVFALDATGHRNTRCLTIFDPVVATLAESSRNLWITGYLARAQEFAARAVGLAQELGHPGSVAFAWLFEGWLRGQQERWTECLAAVERGVAIARESGTIQILMWNRCVRGWAMARAGRPADGLAELADAMSGSQAIMGQVSMPQFTHMRAEVLLHGGNDDLALELVCTALAQAEAHQDHYYSAELYRLRACCHRARGEAGAASAAIRQALTLARTQGAALFELRAALALAGWDPDEGRSAVQEALATLPQPIAWLETTAARRLLTAGETARHNS